MTQPSEAARFGSLRKRHATCLIIWMIERNTDDGSTPKRARGRTAIGATPITTRSRVPLAAETRRSIEQQLGRVLAPFGTRIERASIRLEDVNGPRGGVGLDCTIKVVLSGSRSLIIEERATNPLETVRRALPRVARSIRQHAEQSGRKTPAAGGPRAQRKRSAPRRLENAAAASAAVGESPRAGGAPEFESLMGKRSGRRATGLPAALLRPEKQRRNALVDTAAPGVSEADRKAGGRHTARRNSKANPGGAPYALEDSLGTPSRKSTRGGGARVKAAAQLTRRARRKVQAPSARFARKQ